MAYTSVPSLSLYKEAVRSGLQIRYEVNAYLGGVTQATALRPTGGSITDTTKPGVRRMLSVDFPGEQSMYDLLTPIGTTLTVFAFITYTNSTVISVPMGVFDVDAEKITEGGGTLSVTAPDKWIRIKRAQFIGPQSSVVGRLVTDELISLIQGALGIFEPVTLVNTPTTKVGALTWEKDRAQAIIDLAASIGCWVYFDRSGACIIEKIPTAGPSADWMIDASANGVLTELDRERSRTNTYNVVVVSSSASGGELFPAQYQWDIDPSSPTYAGPDPLAHPDLAGPFGISTYFHDSPVATTAFEARQIGNAILSRTTGLSSQVSLGSVPNPAVDAWDVIDVLPPAGKITTVTVKTVGGRQVPVLSRTSSGAILERHVVDTVTHPLSVDTAQTIEGRSTRADEFQ